MSTEYLHQTAAAFEKYRCDTEAQLADLRAQLSAVTREAAEAKRSIPDIASIQWQYQQTLSHVSQLTTERDTALAECQRLREALREIERWEMPSTEAFWPDGSPISYGARYGSQGEKDVIIAKASAALNPPKPE